MPAWRLGLAALARKLPADEIAPWLDGLKVRRRDADLIAAAITEGPTIAKQLNDSPAPGRDRRCCRAARAGRTALRARPHRPAAAPRLLRAPSGIRLEITGADVADLGLAESPRVGEILDELRRRKLNGELDGRDSELAAARELVEST